MLNSVPVESVVWTARPCSIRRHQIAKDVLSCMGVFVLLSFLTFMAWRGLVSEVDSSIRDFAASLDARRPGDLR